MDMRKALEKAKSLLVENGIILVVGLWWDKTGFWVAQKKLEKGYWPWPNTQEEVKQLNLDQIEMLLKGVDFFKGHEELFFSEIN